MAMKPFLLIPILVLIACSPEAVPERMYDPAPDASQDACVPNTPAPPSDCTGNVPDDTLLACSPEPGDAIELPKDIGARQPTWRLENVQPSDCGYGRTYGLEHFRDAPTVVILLSAGCGFCQQQTVKLQEMKIELMDEGHIFNFVIVNLSSQLSVVENLTDICDFPIFQDTDAVNAWGIHDGVKDDFYFYDQDGILQNFISAQGELEINLSVEEGYANIKNALLALVSD